MSTTAQAVYRDRAEAGRRLAARLERFRAEAPVVVALPRGGVPVAIEVARALAAPLDVLVVRKVGEPGQRVGAVAEGGLAIVDHDTVRALGIRARELAAARLRARAAADAAALRYRAAPRSLVGRTVLIVDDGIGTGASAAAAAQTARHRGAARVVLAVPVAGAAALTRLGEAVDEIVCVEVAPLARWYEQAAAMTDAEIAAALREADPAARAVRLPEGARGAVVIAGAGGVVRATLSHMGFATLPAGDAAGAEAIAAALERLHAEPGAHALALGVFGFGVAAAPALAAAAPPPAAAEVAASPAPPSAGAGAPGPRARVAAVVTAGGRPDRAGGALDRVDAPALLIVGGEDRLGVRDARAAAARLARAEVAVVAGASHEFGEPGALEQVAHLAGGWFARHL